MSEIRQHIANQNYLKAQSATLRGKSYFETRVTKMMLNMFYTIIGIIRNRTKLSERIKKNEIRQALRHPLGIKDIMKFKQHKGINLLFWVIGEMPATLSFATIQTIGKIRKLI
jgi:hypothetical protein